MRQKVMMAMSGGVDSSVAALILKDKGYDVIGVTMCFNLVSGHRKRPSCCGLEGIEDARRVCEQLSVPHYVLNFGKELEEVVVLDFVVEYISGRTPNPCVRCNQYLKFGGLLKKARALGIPYLATGHFARIEKKNRFYFLKKGRDGHKDQSYFLCQTPRSQFHHLIFPVGEMTKQEVRDFAKKRGLAVADKAASQEACFIPDNDYRAFLRNRLNKAYFQQGEIADTQGRVLGHHHGVFNYTIGQREGLGISAANPLYVIHLDADRHRVIVGSKEDVFSRGLRACELNILASSLLKKGAALKAKIRYNHPEAPAKVKRIGRSRLEVTFSHPQPAITPGQFVVLYHNDMVVAGAKITESLAKQLMLCSSIS